VSGVQVQVYGAKKDGAQPHNSNRLRYDEKQGDVSMIDNPNLDVSALANQKNTNSMVRSRKNKEKEKMMFEVMTTEENEDALDTLDDLI
jgi:hypothetical protein